MYPHFMENPHKQKYQSSSILGIIYDWARGLDKGQNRWAVQGGWVAVKQERAPCGSREESFHQCTIRATWPTTTSSSTEGTGGSLCQCCRT